MKFPDPGILLHPNIPKPLHEVNPRSIKGQAWWDVQRQKAYTENSYCCWACAIHKSQAKFHQWLEAHENYSIDYKNGLVKVTEITALCHACHNFIHSGRILMTSMKREEPEGKFWNVMFHGFSVLKAGNLKPNPFALSATETFIDFANTEGMNIPTWAKSPEFGKALQDNPIFDEKMADWADWRLELEGELYEPKYKTFEAWLEKYNPGALQKARLTRLKRILGDFDPDE